MDNIKRETLIRSYRKEDLNKRLADHLFILFTEQQIQNEFDRRAIIEALPRDQKHA